MTVVIRGEARSSSAISDRLSLVPLALPKFIHVDAAAVDNALQSADWNLLISVTGHDHLAAIRMTPLLMAASLPGEGEAVAL